ncbi:hypothetical protein BDV26DRAFT_281329 [Aspergillus bertholletiae]|uniref:Mitochondrial division protein 1 n=1 Tax=Aspergillus bertholletiae TaxID=1226010 RepID=A0A5N7B8X4_9EURO|nr:hypothetical protein BDV26DRAFT_281329 [Aspergillus bertholletiae]
MDQHAEECLPGTRTELLLDIQNWAVSAEGKCIFWLNGLAGTGKSTISRTVAKAFQQQGLLGASFFFKRGEGDCGNAARFFPTLAKQLLIRVPELCSTIIEVIQDNPEISAKPLEEQFDELIYKPLHSLNQSKLSSSCLVIVVDTLDECDHDNDIQLILQLLPRVREFKSLCLRFFITSRPDLLIRLGLNTVDHNDLILHEIPKPIIEHDISLFLKHRLATIRHKRSLSPDWPGDANIQTLVTMSVPLFIVAATICRLFEDHNLDPDQCLTEILKYQNQESKFDGTYLPVLDRLVSNYSGRRQMQLVQEVQEVLGVIILLESPLSVISLSKLMGTSTVSITARLNSLHSVLNIPKDEALPVRLFHLSLRYFLLDPSTREKTPFWVNKEQMNRKLLIRCLLVMQKSLKKNICSLKSYGIERRDINPNSIGHYLPSELQYSCRYWIHHLVQSKDLINQVDYILVFLKEHFLHWVEIMSILGYISEVVQGITVLQSAEDRNDSELFQFLHDAKRFILKYREIADIAPLQLYASGLIFTPKRAITRHFFERELPDWIIRGPEVEVHWSSELQPLKGHSFSVQFLAFSPDGRLLATSSGDRTIQLWDPTTNTVIQTLVGHSFPVQSLVFSPDSRILASGSNDTTIKFWDYTTGTAIQILEGHSSSIQSIAFSLDGQLLASGSNDTTIKLWDPTTGAVIQTLEGHLSSVQSVAFSPDSRLLASDSRLLASGSNDATIKLWDPTTGAIIQTLEGHSSSIQSIAFSLDGQLLIDVSLQTDRWIAIHGQRELWLPPEYRPSCSTVKDATIALGCTNGRVCVIAFSI